MSASVWLVLPGAALGSPDAGTADAGVEAELAPPQAAADNFVDVSKGFRSASLSAVAAWAENPDGRLGIREVASPSAGGLDFRVIGDASPHFEYSTSAFWARTAIANTGSRSEVAFLEVAYALIDDIELYLSRDGGRTWEKRRGGDELPFHAREIEDHNILFSLYVLPGESLRVYMRFESTSSVQLPIVLWSAEEYAQAKGGERLWYGILFGLLVAMVLYHLFLYFPTRNAMYLSYCAYIAFGAAVLAGLTGYGYEYFWPASPWLERVFVPFSITAWIVLACVFTRSFLRTWETSRAVDRVMLALIAVSSLLSVHALVGDVRLATRLNTGVCMVAAVATTAGGFAVWRRGFRAARFFCIAWCVFGAGVLIYAAKSLGLLASNAITQQAMNVGTAVEAVLISMALGDYINALREEQDTARALAARQQAERSAKMAEIRDLAAFLSDVARSMSDVMERLGRSSRDVAAALAEANATIEEIEKTATNVSRNAARIAGDSKRLSKDFDRGREAMDSTASAIDRVQSESERIAAMTKTLFSHIEEVDDVVGSVRSVSAQSQVLAVNASIEAANAGTLGKGFGVIAVEVSHLAQQSTEATAHVNELLGSIRASLGKIVEAAGHGAAQTKSGSSAIGAARGVVGELAVGVGASAAQADQIATSIAEQTSGITHILGAMERIGRTAAENLEATKGMSRAAADVERTVDKLRELVKSWGSVG